MTTPKPPKHKLYTAAYNCFVEQGMTCAGIADMLGIREATLSEWRRAMKWDEKRKAMLAAPGKIRELLLNEMQNVADGNPARIDTDGLSKIAKALQYFDGKGAPDGGDHRAERGRQLHRRGCPAGDRQTNRSTPHVHCTPGASRFFKVAPYGRDRQEISETSR